MYKVNFIKKSEDAIIPTKAHINDAGFDIYSPFDTFIYPKHCVVIDTMISLDIQVNNETFAKNYILYFQIKGRSGMSIKKSIEVCNAGVVDQDYKGNILIKLYNFGKKIYRINKGDRIAQGIFYIIPRIETGEIFNNIRGENGIGSTGK